MKLSAFLTITAVCCAMAACNSAKDASSNTDAADEQALAVASPQTIATIVGDWDITDIAGKPVADDVTATVSFATPEGEEAAEGMVLCYATGGCNTFNGTYAVTEGNGLNLNGELLSTMMMCPDNNYDSELAKALNAAKGFTFTEGTEDELVLVDADSNPLATLRKQNMDYINGAWKVTSINGSSLPADVNLEMVIDLPEGKLHADGLCNVINGKVKTNISAGGALTFTDIASTRMSCPQMELEQAFIAALNAVKTAAKTGNNAIALRNADGAAIITATRLTEAQLRN